MAETLPIEKRFVWYQWANWDKSYQWLTAVDGPPAVEDLGSRTGRMQVRKTPTVEPIIELTTENGRIVLDDDGTIAFHLDDEDTGPLSTGIYRFDFHLIAGDDPLVFFTGQVEVKAGITHDDV